MDTSKAGVSIKLASLLIGFFLLLINPGALFGQDFLVYSASGANAARFKAWSMLSAALWDLRTMATLQALSPVAGAK
jgi:hypothetical protein